MTQLPETLLTTKWAVRIESEADMEQLVKMFPKVGYKPSEVPNIMRHFCPKLCVTPFHIWSNYKFTKDNWGHDKEDYFVAKGYKIYTVKQLKKLIR